MVTSQILKSVDFTKAQKSRYLEVETFVFQIKKNSSLIKRYFMTKNFFVAEVTFNTAKLFNDLIFFSPVIFD